MDLICAFSIGIAQNGWVLTENCPDGDPMMARTFVFPTEFKLLEFLSKGILPAYLEKYYTDPDRDEEKLLSTGWAEEDMYPASLQMDE